MYKRNQVFAAACIALFLFGMTLITLGSILPSLTTAFESAGLNKGFLVSILHIGLMAGSLVFGPHGDRDGFKCWSIARVALLGL